MTDERLVPIEDLLADPVLVAVADAYVRTEWVSSEPPVWNSLAERIAAIEQTHGRKEAESQAWQVLSASKRFVAMFGALWQAKFDQLRREHPAFTEQKQE